MKKYIFLVLGFFLVLNLSAQNADSTALDSTASQALDSPTDAEQLRMQDSLAAAEKIASQQDYFEAVSPRTNGGEDISGYPLGLDKSDNMDFSSFRILDSIAKNNRFIFTGEDHRVEGLNTRLESKMMRYLYSNHKEYNYYLMEAGYATAWMVNEVLMNNNDTLKESLKNYFSPNFYQLFSELEEVNLARDSRQPLQAVGLDIERNIPIALKLLRYLLPKEAPSDSLEMFTESLNILSAIHEAQGKDNKEDYDEDQDIFAFGNFDFNLADFDDENYEFQEEKYFFFNSYKTVVELTKEFRRKEQEFKVYLGEKYVTFERVIKELEVWQVWIKYEMEGLPQSWVYRELYMEGNFKTFFSDKPSAKGFGQFGRCHTTRITKSGDCGFAFFSSLNKRIITKMPELKNQVASIGIFYPGMEYGNDYTDNGNIVDLIDASDNGEATLYIDLQDYADTQLQQKFSAIIIAKSNNAPKKGAKRNTSNAEDGFRAGLFISYQRQNINLSKFTTATSFALKEPIEFFEIGYYAHENHSFWLDNSFSFMIKQNATYTSDTTGMITVPFESRKMTLTGWTYRYSLGGDLLRPRWIDLAPMAGFGYQQLTYTEEQLNVLPTSFGTNPKTTYRNPSFFLDFRLHLNFNSSWFTLSTYTGYLLDLSDTRWISGGKKVESSPRTSHNNLFYGAGLSINFNQ